MMVPGSPLASKSSEILSLVLMAWTTRSGKMKTNGTRGSPKGKGVFPSLTREVRRRWISR